MLSLNVPIFYRFSHFELNPSYPYPTMVVWADLQQLRAGTAAGIANSVQLLQLYQWVRESIMEHYILLFDILLFGFPCEAGAVYGSQMTLDIMWHLKFKFYPQGFKAGE